MDDPPPLRRLSFSRNPRSRHPVLHLPLSRQEHWLEIASLIGLLLMFAFLIWGWLILPSNVPVHYSPTGQSDQYGNKEVLLLLPILSVIISIMFSFLCRFPHLWNYPWPITQENAPRHYRLARTMMRWIKLELCWLLAYIEWMMIQSAREQHLRVFFLVVIFCVLLVMLATVMRYLIVAEPN